MGGPTIGIMEVDGVDLGDGFMNSWLWSTDCKHLLLLFYVSRAPDVTEGCIFDLVDQRLIETGVRFGFSLPPATFDGREVVYENQRWGKVVLR